MLASGADFPPSPAHLNVTMNRDRCLTCSIGRAHQERRQSARYRPLGYVGDGFHRPPVRCRCLDAASHGLRVWKPLRVGGAAGGFEPVLPARRLLAPLFEFGVEPDAAFPSLLGGDAARPLRTRRVIAPSSQELEPPTFPGRFNPEVLRYLSWTRPASLDR